MLKTKKKIENLSFLQKYLSLKILNMVLVNLLMLADNILLYVGTYNVL